MATARRGDGDGDFLVVAGVGGFCECGWLALGGEAAGWRRAGRGEHSFGRGHALLGAHLSVTVYGLASQAMLKIIERPLLEFYV